MKPPAAAGALIIALSLLGGGCAPSKSVVRDRTLPVGEVFRRVETRNTRIRTLHGEGTITVESPEGSGSGTFDAQLRKPDSLLVEFKGPFGIQFATLMLSRDTFLFYNRMENRAIVGRPDGATLQSMLRLKMRFDEVINAFTGEFPAPESADSLERFGVNDDGYIVRYSTGAGRREYRVDDGTFIVTSYRIYGKDGATSVAGSAARLDEDRDLPVPRLIRVIVPRENRSVTIAYDDVETNVPVRCAYVIPEQAELSGHR